MREKVRKDEKRSKEICIKRIMIIDPGVLGYCMSD